jgi:hypothetical protein
MGSFSAVALDAAAAWDMAGFVGIGLGIVRLLIGATATAMVEVDRIACSRARQGRCQWYHFFMPHIFYGRNSTGQKNLQRPKWARSLRG